jgi:hypothetical protein
MSDSPKRSAWKPPPDPPKRITPFQVVITIDSQPERGGYQHTASAIGIVDGQTVPIKVSSYLGWVRAEYLGPIKHYITVDASAIVPLVEKANND